MVPFSIIFVGEFCVTIYIYKTSFDFILIASNFLPECLLEGHIHHHNRNKTDRFGEVPLTTLAPIN